MTLTIIHKHLRSILDNLNEDNWDDLMMELKYSTLIAPAGDDLPLTENRYIPLFTDIHEFNKFNRDNKYRHVPHEFNDYLEILGISDLIRGFMINPDSEKFTLSREFLEDMGTDYIFDQDYQPFTSHEIRKLKNSINNTELNDFIKDETLIWDLEKLVRLLNDSLLLTLLISKEGQEAENGVIPIFHTIPKCLHEVGGRNYLLLFSREVTTDFIEKDIHGYSQIVNFPLAIKEVLNNDLDGFILNIDDKNLTVPREALRDFMKDFRCPCIDDYSRYAFTIGESE